MKLSYITPIHNRQEYLPKLFEMFQAQTHSDKELVLVDDSDELWPKWALFLLPDNIKYIPLSNKHTIGHKRNIACAAATGDLIVHFDSDDTYADDWGEKCLLIYQDQNSDPRNPIDVIGLRNGVFVNNTQKWLYTCMVPRKYVLGATMCYSKQYWLSHKFPHVVSGEDAEFLFSHNANIYEHRYIEGFTASIHAKNTCKRFLTGDEWSLLSTMETE